MARPPSDDPKRNFVRVKLTDAEAEALKGAADAKGWPLSAWIREAALHVAKRPPKRLR